MKYTNKLLKFKKVAIYGLTAACFTHANPVFSMGKDDPLLTMVRFHELQYLQEGDHDVIEWNADGWIGKDLSKVWIKTEGELAKTDDGTEVESGNVELLYSEAFSPFWDWQVGVRHDFKPEVDNSTRNWLSVGAMGTAYNFWDVDTSLFISDESDVQLRIQYEREYMLTQNWVLTPEIELIINSDDNESYGDGAGLSETELSLRLGYEKSRNFQPYIGITSHQTFGNARSFRKNDGEDSGNISATIGLHFWF